MYKQICIYSSLFLFFLGCAHRALLPEAKERPNVYSHTVIGKKGVIQFDTMTTRENQYAVNSLMRDSEAERAGLRHADVLIAFDGRPIVSDTSLADLYDYVYDSPNRKITLTVQSNHRTRDISFRIPQKDILAEYTDIDALKRLLYVGNIVNLAVIVERVNYIGPGSDSKNIGDWKESTSHSLLNAIEGIYLEVFGLNNQFHLTDRATIDKVLAELKFQLSGAVAARDVKALGNLAGASYIAFTTIERTTSPKLQDYVTIRLENVETGTVIASANRTIKYQ